MNKDALIAQAAHLRAHAKADPARRNEHLVQLADVYVSLRYYKEASAVCRAILKSQPFNVGALLRLGKALLGQDNSHAASRLYDALTSSFPSLSEAWWGLWATRQRQGKPELAVQALENLLKKYPDDLLARRCLADGYLELSKPLAAIIQLEILWKAGERPKELAQLLIDASELSRALTHLQAALKEKPRDCTLLMQACEVSFRLRDYDCCCRLAARALEAGAISTRPLELLGRSRLELEEHDGAILALEKLVDKAPDQLDFRHALAEAYFRANELVEAQREFTRCLARDPGRPDTVLRLAEIAWRLSQRERAEELYERCIKMEPGNGLALFRLGLLRLERHIYAGALTCFRRLMVAQPNNVKAHLYLGRCLRITGSFPRSRNHLSRARELNSKCPETRFELGLLDLELHRVQSAREHFEHTLELNPEGTWGKRAAYELRHLEQDEGLRKAANDGPHPTNVHPSPPRWIKLC